MYSIVPKRIVKELHVVDVFLHEAAHVASAQQWDTVAMIFVFGWGCIELKTLCNICLFIMS